MKILLKSALCLLVASFALGSNESLAQSRRIYLQPDLAFGLTGGYDYGNSLKIDNGEKNGWLRLECRAGYYLNNHWSAFTGAAFATYRYHMRIEGETIETGHPDVTRDQEQALVEIPLGVRYTTYNDGKKFCKTRFYGGGGFRIGLLNDGRYDYRTVGGGPSGYQTEAGDFNNMHVRAFLEGGIDVPLDWNSAFLIGLNVSHGVTRNMSSSGDIEKSNYGVLAYGLNLGFRFGL